VTAAGVAEGERRRVAASHALSVPLAGGILIQTTCPGRHRLIRTLSPEIGW
jgi:hypothetical protein